MSKKIFSYLAVAALLFVGCSKSDDNTTNGGADENYDIYLKFDLGAATRADAKEVTSGTVTQFSQGAVFFTNSNGDILRMALIDDSPAGAVTSTEIQAGYLFTDIDNDAIKVYVVGNHDFGSTTYANITDVQSVTKGILSQTDDNFGVDHATLYGFGDIVATTPSPANQQASREAIFTVSPIIARLEIDGIEGSGDITDFNLAGIYINNFYINMSVAGTTVPGDLKHHGTNLADFDKYLQKSTAQANGAYLPTWSKYLFDDGGLDGSGVFNGLSTTAGLTHNPVNGTWAYNVFANGSAVPHIILHFTDLEISGTPRANSSLGAGNDGVAYLTITGYTNNITNADQPILGGNVYKLDNILFDHTDLDEYPYEKDDKDAVFVKVTVKPWNVIPVGWK